MYNEIAKWSVSLFLRAITNYSLIILQILALGYFASPTDTKHNV